MCEWCGVASVTCPSGGRGMPIVKGGRECYEVASPKIKVSATYL